MQRYFLLSFAVVLAAILPAQPFFPDLDGQELIDALAQEFRPGSVLSYGDARDLLYGEIDRRNDSLYCVYTDFGIQMTPGADPSNDAFSKGINTEHTWPRSKGAENGFPNSDMHHLFPTQLDVNNDRGSLPFGEISDNVTDRWYYLSIETTNTPSAAVRDLYSELRTNVSFEPREAHKGNVARAMFYFWTVYRNEALAADPNFFPSQINTLCDWHEQDPVDSRELQRSEAIAEHQDDKVNPFVVDCNLLQRSYCPDVSTVACISSTEDDFGVDLPFGVSGVGRSTSGAPYVMLSLTEDNLSLEVDWLDMLGRKVSFTSEDWLSTGTFQLIMANKVAMSAESRGPIVARIKLGDRSGKVYLRSVLVP
ncbi:endonuclease I [Lewinellaceae bacterium SD302]|nr:endonuclease I [Lewinellaceae bacterium SD302]